jgi:hypothetical protein
MGDDQLPSIEVTKERTENLIHTRTYIGVKGSTLDECMEKYRELSKED